MHLNTQLNRGVRVALRNAALYSSSSAASAPRVQNFINGKFEDSKATQWIDLYNPANQELVCQVPHSTQEELERATAGAAEAFKTWKEVPIQQRQVKGPCCS